MRTLKEDLMHVVKDRKISIVRAVALEEEKKRGRHEQGPAEISMHRQRSRRMFATLFTAFVLFILGGAALAGVLSVQSQHSAASFTTDNSSLIFAEQKLAFPLQDLSGGEIKRLFAKQRGSPSGHLGSITRIVPTLPSVDAEGNPLIRPASTREFLAAIGAHIPEILAASLSDVFFLGIHTIDKNSPVIIIPVKSYDKAFSGMLEWEPSMNTDLAPAFTAVPQFIEGEGGLTRQRTFSDIVIRNYDARALRDDSGVIQLYYSFPNPNVLIIAENQYSFTELLSRLQVARRL